VHLARSRERGTPDRVLAGTFVKLENSRVVGDRIYLLLLIGDHDGEETLESLGR
jgi:hypothetical protein